MLCLLSRVDVGSRFQTKMEAWMGGGFDGQTLLPFSLVLIAPFRRAVTSVFNAGPRGLLFEYRQDGMSRFVGTLMGIYDEGGTDGY